MAELYIDNDIKSCNRGLNEFGQKNICKLVSIGMLLRLDGLGELKAIFAFDKIKFLFHINICTMELNMVLYPVAIMCTIF